jgi:type IV pilus assembly protein PilW
VPSLRRKSLANIVAGPAVIDEEIVPGVEDLQVRFGIDTNGDTNADSYVDPGGVGNARVVSATIWLRIRAEDREQGHNDTRTYNYGFPGATDFTPPAGEQRKYRRIVVSRTIQLRNTRV